MKFTALLLFVALAPGFTPKLFAQEKVSKNADVFDKVKMIFIHEDKADEVPVRLRLEENSMIVQSRKTGSVLKEFKYSDVRSAEYSYSKHPRWKAGAGTAAASLLLGPGFVLALPIAIPLAFSK